jgi:hypothetical protein
MWSLRRFSHAYSCRTAAQGCAVGHGRPLTHASLAGFVQVDLPVDVVVVLEQQERADQGERVVRSAREWGWSALGEHVFVKDREPRGRTGKNIRTHLVLTP